MLLLEVADNSSLYCLPSDAVYSWSQEFSVTLYLYTGWILLAPFCGRSLKLLWLLGFLKKLTSLATGSLFLFVFQKVALRLKFVVSPFPTDGGVFLRALSFLDWLFLPHLGAHTESWLQSGFSTPGVWSPTQPAEISLAEDLPETCEHISCLNPECNWQKLCSFNAFWCSLLLLSPFPVPP